MHGIKKAAVLLILLVFLAANSLLSYILYPYTYTRAMFYEMQNASYDTLITGGSHAKCGIDPSVLSARAGMTAINAAQGGEHMIDMYYLVREAAKDTELKTVICEIDPSYWVNEPNQTQEYVSLYHEFPASTLKIGYFSDKMLQADFRTAPFEWYLYRKQVAHLPDLIREKRSRAYREYDIAQFTDEVQSYSLDGFIARFRVDEGTTREDVPALWNQEDLNPDEQKYFEKLVDFCDLSEIKLVTVIPPIPNTTYEMYRDSFTDAEDFFQAYMSERGIRFLNYIHTESKLGDLDNFCDNEGHMFEDAAALFTTVLADDL